MNQPIVVVLLALVTVINAVVVTERDWTNYKNKYGKQYSGYEDTRRRSNYVTNLIYINLHNIRANSKLVSYHLAPNQFSDMTKIEFFQMIGGRDYATNIPPPLRKEAHAILAKAHEIPPFRNWTQDGAGYGISDQGVKCNAAWAFSALAAIEAHYFQANAVLPPKLSVQNLIDCAGGFTACSGRQIPETVYDYIEFQSNVNTEASYPYTGKQAFCKYNPSDVGCVIGGYQTVKEDDDNSLLQLLAWETPLVVGFNPFSFEFMHYASGIFTPPRNTINFYHKYFVTVVGYGTDMESHEDYWIIKNSMGNSWGEFGYMRMIRNSNYPIAKHASFANL